MHNKQQEVASWLGGSIASSWVIILKNKDVGANPHVRPHPNNTPRKYMKIPHASHLRMKENSGWEAILTLGYRI